MISQGNSDNVEFSSIFEVKNRGYVSAIPTTLYSRKAEIEMKKPVIRSLLTAKIGNIRFDQSDRFVSVASLAEPTGLTGGSDWSDRSKRSPNTIRDFYRFRSVQEIPCGINPSYPINIKGHGRLGHPTDQTTHQYITFLYVYCFYLYLQTLAPSNPFLLFFLRLRDV